MVLVLLLLGFVSPGTAADKNASAFLTFRVDSPKILRRVVVLKNKISENEPELEKYLEETEKLHITIDLYHVDEKNRDRARIAMDMIQKELCAVNKRVTFNGTDMFDSRVLFANLTQKSHDVMKNIQEISKKNFEENGIKSLNQYAYHPHMTIAQLSTDRKDLEPKLAKFKGTSFIGSQKFHIIYFCAMHAHNTGFYKILEQRSIGNCR